MVQKSTELTAANRQPDTIDGGPLIVIPCLNEVQHISALLSQLDMAQKTVGGRIVVVDGGSTDGTQHAVQNFTRNNNAIFLIHNPNKIQSAAINLAVKRFGDDTNTLIRIDAHSSYPDDFCQVLMAEARQIDAASIVVSMEAVGTPGIQKINAAAQNSPVGNGGSSHRNKTHGQFVEHGHHALISIAAFRDVGGYDPEFSHNEDAELDYRLGKAGYKIWLTSKTGVTYFPRCNFIGLAKQYYNFGRGRARNHLKHRVIPRLRQAKVMLVLPAVLGLSFSGIHWSFALPAMLWVAFCLASGAQVAAQERDIKMFGTGIVAMLMHLAWSIGFWQNVLFGPYSTPQEDTQ